MDKQGIVRVLGPALAAAAVVLLVGVLVFKSEWGGEQPAPGKPLTPSAATKGNRVAVDPADANDAGMVDSLPPADAPEWKDLGDGLKMWDVKVGTGGVESECPAGANVSIHYTGWTLNGSSFDSSRKGANSPPANFGLGSLIKGWQLGIPGMKPGGVRRLLIPGPLAYGAGGGGGGKIPPNATLIFEIKMLGFN